MVEFIDGYGGYLMTHEWFIYIFDALLMSIAMAVMNVYPTSRCSITPSLIFLQFFFFSSSSAVLSDIGWLM